MIQKENLEWYLMKQEDSIVFKRKSFGAGIKHLIINIESWMMHGLN